MHQTFRHNLVFVAALGLMLSPGSCTASAQRYRKTALV